MKHIKIIYIISFFLFLLANSGLANNITFANQDFGAQDTNTHTRIVQFDISWENSWRDDENYDCPWIFLKYSTDGGTTWHHGALKTSGTNPSGFNQGSGIGLDIIVPSDKKGAYLRRTLTGEGTVDTDGIQLVWDYGTDLGADAAGDQLAAFASVRVMGMEMCYIPQAPFYVGDYMYAYTYFPTCQPRDRNKSQNIGPYGYQIMVRTNDVHAMNITCYASYYQSTGPYDDCDTDKNYAGLIAYCYDTVGAPSSCPGIWFDGGLGIARTNSTYDETDFNTNWPTGFKAFYLARYEVSQAQYRDFLNTLTPAQAVNRYVGSAHISEARFGLKADNGIYGCDLNDNGIFDENSDGECIPSSVNTCNDGFAYNDWCATRLITDFEFEKAARGTNAPVQFERAGGYGGASIYPTSYNNSGAADEAPSNNGESEAWMLYNITSLGPLRCGALATDSSSRKKANAGYYGCMDLSGNIFENCISVGTTKGRSYTALHGNGELTASGYADVTDWPGGEGLSTYGAGYNYLADRAIANRGGGWDTTPGSQTGGLPVYLASRALNTLIWNYNWPGTSISGKWRNSNGLRGGRTAE